MYSQWALSIEDAKAIASACRTCAEQNGWNVVIAIVDDGGHTMYLERLDGTQKASSVVAQEKAKTALLFKRPTQAIEAVVANGRNVMMMLPGATPIEGGLPQASGWTRLRGQPYARQAWQLHWPLGPSTAGLQPVPGSHRAGMP